jgi:thioredoxin 1
VEQLAGEFAGKVKVVKAKIQEAFSTASDLGIMSIPTLVFYKGGEEVGRLVGAVPKDTIVAAIAEKLGV